MLPYIILGVVLGLPIFFGLFFRVSASHLFFAVMTGELLGRYFGKDAEHFISSTFKDGNLTHYSEAIVLTLPIILTALFLKGSISRTKGVLNFFPLIITSIVYAAFLLPVLPHDVQEVIASVPIGRSLLDTSNVIIGGVVLIQLVALWVLNRGENSKKRRKSKSKD
jgi:hypothetical protein